jgi:hypothetical protein
VAIKTIKGKKYYYRNRRIGKQVISEYIGTGHTALLMSQLDEHEREQAKLRRRAWKEIQRREAAIDAQIDELGDHIKALVDAHLIISGMHQHKREWRRKRAPIE